MPISTPKPYRGGIESPLGCVYSVYVVYLYIICRGAYMFHIGNRGQGLVEYAMLIMLVALLLIVLLLIFGQGVGNAYSNIIMNI
jgi:pilus assembly protein Flp/PilA